MNTPANPANWNRIQVDPAATGQPRQIVPGIPAIAQPVILFKDEWLCAGCHAPITSDGSTGWRIHHNEGCSAVADLFEILKGLAQHG